MSDRERQIKERLRLIHDEACGSTRESPLKMNGRLQRIVKLSNEALDALAAVPSEVTDEQEALRQIRDFDAWRGFPGKQDRPETATSQAMRKIARAALEAAR